MKATLKPETEVEFTRTILKLAKLHGWRSAHFRPARLAGGQWRTPVQGDGKGFPDLLLIQPATGRMLVAELKAGDNVPTPEQRLWLAAFAEASVPAYVWRPEDWPQIERILSEPNQR